MAVSNESLLLAIRNVAQHGDTDVYPYPLENHWFHDDEATVLSPLQTIDQRFDEHLGHTCVYLTSLSPVGYVGFRGATQIDPIWNAYSWPWSLKSAPIERTPPPSGDHVLLSLQSREAATLTPIWDGELSARRRKAAERQVIISHISISTPHLPPST